jgi:hypothetical protein
VKILVSGWFSFEGGHATVGDLLSRDIVVRWLEARGWSYDVASVPPFPGDLHWQQAQPAAYNAVIFMCGPFCRPDRARHIPTLLIQPGELEAKFLQHFANVPVFGLNLSMLEHLDRWNPFQQLWERDSSRTARPDLVFLSESPLVPVIGVCKVEPYAGGRTELTDPAIDQLLAEREAAVITIDTRLDTNSTGLRTPPEVESLIARVDALVTTRLHGTVLALKNGIPVLAIDPEAGGFKIKRQAETIGWPLCFVADQLDAHRLSEALNYCLTPAARVQARSCAARARQILQSVEAEVVHALIHCR